MVDNSTRAKFLRDSPHFTLMCARTGNMGGFRNALREVCQRFHRIKYEIIGVEDNLTPGDLIEIRTIVAEEDRKKFYDLHMAVLEASLSYNNAGLYERFEKGFSGEMLENIRFCGFPLARSLYKPHESLGRVHRNIRPNIQGFIDSLDPREEYTSSDLIVWVLPFDKDDPTATPKHLETIRLLNV